MTAEPGVLRGSLPSQVAELLSQYLRDEKLPAGAAIPSTGMLAKKFDVSTPVIREAVAQLVGQGRLSSSQGRATVVRTPTATDLAGIFRSRMDDEDDVILQMHDYRVVLEVGSARLAAERATPADIDKINSCLETWRGLPQESPEFLRADMAFHQAIAESTRNELLAMTMDAVASLLFEARVLGWHGWLESGHTIEPIDEAHKAVVEAIADHDGDRAAREMQEHLDQARVGLDSELGRD